MSNKDEFINDVKSFLSVKKLEIDSILSRLNWDEETLMQQVSNGILNLFSNTHSTKIDVSSQEIVFI